MAVAGKRHIDLVYVIEALRIYDLDAEPRRVVKIGHTTNLTRRMADFYTMIPTDLNLWGIIVGGEAQEQRLHAALAAARFRGEWFHAAPSVFRVLQNQILQSPHHFPQIELWQLYQIANGYRTQEVTCKVDGDWLEIPSPQEVFTNYDLDNNPRSWQ